MYFVVVCSQTLSSGAVFHSLSVNELVCQLICFLISWCVLRRDAHLVIVASH